ncbi:MAG: class II aldolase/adducin family protein [Bacteroidales bacterium]|nr:class II aldolase/adducin family protein [Bacteroidales bacterium]MBN2764597.1 class II aldolase/adducin family protein [Bacteroidales bacterium]
MKEEKLNTYKKEVAYFMRRLYRQRLTTTSGGNISYRFDEERILITPSALDKGRMRSDQIGLMMMTGKNLTPVFKPSIECGMHMAIYEKRHDVKAIVHAHPPIASAFTALNRSINCALTAEARAILGIPRMAPYALMGTTELADIVSRYITDTNVILLENHGIICLGPTLLAAFDRMEVLEAAAKMTLITELLKDKKELNPRQLREIDDLLA